MESLSWNIDVELKSLPEIEYRNQFALYLSKYTPQEICQRYVYMDYHEIHKLVKKIKNKGIDLYGIGLEPGAGCGLLSAAFLNNFPEINKVYALDIVEELPKTIIPIIAKEFIENNFETRIIPTHGSFNNIELPNNSLDFIVELDSFHHSDNLLITLTEINRVLKPNGVLVAIDRSQPNSISQKEIDDLLNIQYSKEFLLKNHYPMDRSFTRKENGEHEYRLNEWQNAFYGAGFKNVKTYYVKPKFSLKGFFILFFRTIILNKNGYSCKTRLRLLFKEFNKMCQNIIHHFNNHIILTGNFEKTLFLCYK